MKIIIIQKAAPDIKRDMQYDSASFDNAAREALDCSITPIDAKKTDASAYRIYTGTDSASAQTAAALFDMSEAPEQTPLLNDIPVRSFRDTEKTHSYRFWQNMGKIQWYLGNDRQPETRTGTLKRVQALLEQLEEEEKDCVLITGGLTRSALLQLLSRRGYLIEGERREKPLARVRATKKNMHCGGCMHNCLLTDPGCDIGKDKARRER